MQTWHIIIGLKYRLFCSCEVEDPHHDLRFSPPQPLGFLLHLLLPEPKNNQIKQKLLYLLSNLTNLKVINISFGLQFVQMDEQPLISEDGDMDQIVEGSNGNEVTTTEEICDMEPYIGMEFESEEAAKVFYDGYATRLGFIMRVDAFRRSMRDGKVVWRRLVCNKEGFRKLRPRRSENRKPRAITREGCKAMIVVKKEKTGKWVVTKFVKEHNHPLVAIPSNGRRSVLLSQTPDEKDTKIRELTAELQRERKRSAAYQEQLYMVLKDMEEHSNHLSRNIEDIVRSVKEIENKW